MPPCVTATSVSDDLIFAMESLFKSRILRGTKRSILNTRHFSNERTDFTAIKRENQKLRCEYFKIYCTPENYALNSNFSCSLWHAEETCINRRNTKQETQTLSISCLPREKFIRISFLG